MQDGALGKSENPPASTMQDDVLYETLTVYETLLFAATLRLPRNMSRAQKVIEGTTKHAIPSMCMHASSSKHFMQLSVAALAAILSASLHLYLFEHLDLMRLLPSLSGACWQACIFTAEISHVAFLFFWIPLLLGKSTNYLS